MENFRQDLAVTGGESIMKLESVSSQFLRIFRFIQGVYLCSVLRLSQIRRCRKQASAVCFIVFVSPLTVSLANDLQRLAMAVEDNAKLYDSMELIVKGKFVLNDLKFHDQRHPREISYQYHVVLQGECVYYDFDSEMTLLGDDLKSENERIRSDGVTSKALVNQIANISTDKQDIFDGANLRPHNILFIRKHMDFPISWFILGGNAMKVPPANNYVSNGDVISEYLGLEEVDGLLCEKICTYLVYPSAKSKENAGRILTWFAKERNLIPIRFECYSPQTSVQSKPNQVGRVLNFTELNPGIYFPKEILFNSFTIDKKTQEPMPLAEYRFSVSKVKLDPMYDLVFFQELEFPRKTRVYHVKNGKIVKEYTVDPNDSESANSLSWLIYVFAGILLFLVLVLIIRGRRKPAKS